MNMKRAIALLLATGMLLPLPASSTYILDGGTGTGSNRLSFTGYIEKTVGSLDSFDVYWTDGTKKAANGSSLDIAQSHLENHEKTKAKGTLLRWKATGQPGNTPGSSLSITIGITVSPLVGEDGRTVVPGTIFFSRTGTSYTGTSYFWGRITYTKGEVKSDGSCTWTYGGLPVVTETATKAEDTAETATWANNSGADDRKSWNCTYTVTRPKSSSLPCQWHWSGDVAIDMKTDGLPSQKYEGTIWIDIASK